MFGRKVGMNSETKKATSLISDSVTIQTLRDFLASEKPASMTPVDILHVIELTLRKAEDHAIFDSQQTLAKAFCCDRKTIIRSQQRLVKLKWLSRPKRKGRTNALSLNFENIPTERTLRSLITPDAGKLAHRYKVVLQKLGRRKFSRHWINAQTSSAQRILDQCGGDLEAATRLIEHALSNPKHRSKAKKSLYELFGKWSKIVQTYAAQQGDQQPEQRADLQAVLAEREQELDQLFTESDEQ
jgi:hypothetical protein